MDITAEQITPFLDAPIPAGKTDNVTAWLTAISAQLTVAFGQALPTTIAPAVYDIVADAVSRRLTRGQYDPRIASQATGPSNVSYNAALASLTGWFYPGEINTLTGLFGGNMGTLSSVRTPAPDGVRFGNLSRRHPDLVDEVGILGVGVSDDFDQTFESDPDTWPDWDGDAS